MKKIEELRNYLLENYVDESGNLVLNNLDFSDFNGDVYIGYMKYKVLYTNMVMKCKGAYSKTVRKSKVIYIMIIINMVVNYMKTLQLNC